MEDSGCSRHDARLLSIHDKSTLFSDGEIGAHRFRCSPPLRSSLKLIVGLFIDAFGFEGQYLPFKITPGTLAGRAGQILNRRIKAGDHRRRIFKGFVPTIEQSTHNDSLKTILFGI